MRLKLRLVASKDQLYDNDYNYKVQSFVYNIIRNSEFHGIHDSALLYEGSPYDFDMMNDSIALIKDEAGNITSELDYVRLTNSFYDRSWRRSDDAEDRFEEIWNRVHYVYRANLSEEGMM